MGRLKDKGGTEMKAMVNNGDRFFDDRNGRYLTVDGFGIAPDVCSCIEQEIDENGDLMPYNRVLMTAGELNRMQRVD